MADQDIIRVRVEAKSLDALRAFIDETEPDLGCRPAARQVDDNFVTDVYLPELQVEAARSARSAADVNLTVMENTTKMGLARQAEVGQGNRFAVRGLLPRGLGRKE